REALAKMMRGDLAADQEATVAVADTGGAAARAALPAAAATALADLLDAYFTIQGALAGDTMDGVPAAAERVAKAVDAMLATPVPGAEQFWHEHDEVATVRGEA